MVSRTRAAAGGLKRRLLPNPAAHLKTIAFRCAKIADHGGGFVFQDEIQPGLAIFRLDDTPFLPGETLGNKSAGQRVAIDQNERFHFARTGVGSRIQKELPPSRRDS